MGILRLGGRPKVRLFLRFDRFDRFVSALLFAPRDHINGELREKIHAILAKRPERAHVGLDPAIDESALVRMHYIIGRNQGPRPQVDVRALEREIADAITTWDDAFLEALSRPSWPRRGPAPPRPRAPRNSRPAIAAPSPPMKRRADLEILETLAAARRRPEGRGPRLSQGR